MALEESRIEQRQASGESEVLEMALGDLENTLKTLCAAREVDGEDGIQHATTEMLAEVHQKLRRETTAVEGLKAQVANLQRELQSATEATSPSPDPLGIKTGAASWDASQERQELQATLGQERSKRYGLEDEAAGLRKLVKSQEAELMGARAALAAKGVVDRLKAEKAEKGAETSDSSDEVNELLSRIAMLTEALENSRNESSSGPGYKGNAGSEGEAVVEAAAEEAASQEEVVDSGDDIAAKIVELIKVMVEHEKVANELRNAPKLKSLKDKLRADIGELAEQVEARRKEIPTDRLPAELRDAGAQPGA